MPGIDLQSVLLTVGYVGIALMIFAETGLLAGFFLPGDSLLITVGLLAQRGHFSLAVLLPLLFVAAVVGDAVGFEIGRHAGPRLFRREESRFFKRTHLERARAFYERHGGKTIVLGRFLAIVRTFVPTVAGAAQMPYRKFAVYNFIGAALWVASMLWLGYGFGQAFKNIEIVLMALLAVMVGLSLVPVAWHLWRERRLARRAAAS